MSLGLQHVSEAHFFEVVPDPFLERILKCSKLASRENDATVYFNRNTLSEYKYFYEPKSILPFV